MKYFTSSFFFAMKIALNTRTMIKQTNVVWLPEFVFNLDIFFYSTLWNFILSFKKKIFLTHLHIFFLPWK